MDRYHDMIDCINISDVIEVIENTDPGFAEGTARRHDKQVLSVMPGSSIEGMKPMPLVGSGNISPYVEIIEQPASKALRFRYECEGRWAGSIPGINSTPENKTFPTIRIVGYKGRAVIVVSCVTKDPPYRPHPHNLVGKEACRRGVCTVEISSENMTMTFAGLGIQCVKKKDVEEALKVREEIRVDPFRTGFEHKKHPSSIDPNAVRLCFQVFIEGSEKGKFTVPLPSIVSDPIYDKKAMSDLVICKLSHCSAPAAGGMEMMILCEKVAKEDIQVRFFEEQDGQVVWEAFGDFQPSNVHKQVAIAFRTPAYCNQQIDQPVHIYIQLKRPSDHSTSDALPFQMIPLGAGRPGFWFMRKALTRKKADPDTFNKILATGATIIANRKIPRNTSDKFNNNNLDIAISQGKISTLRAMNDLYNMKNDTELQDNTGKIKLNYFGTNDIIKKTVVDIDNIEFISGTKPRIINNNEFDNTVVTVNDIIRINIEKQNATIPDIQYQPATQKNDWFDYSQVSKWVQTSQPCVHENIMNDELKNEDNVATSFNELLNQVDELDEIYADTHMKIRQGDFFSQDLNKPFTGMDVHDNQTYTSLQMAMKNPIELLTVKEERKYEDVAISNPEICAPIIQTPSILAAKRDMTRTYEEKLPPLPPKRIRKMSLTPVSSDPLLFHKTSSSNNATEAPHKHLPCVPRTLTKTYRQNLFAKLFSKKSRKDDDLSIEIMKNRITTLENGVQVMPPIPSHLPLSSFHLQKSSDVSSGESPPCGIDLTEAEHYALYTSMAPHATISEFDDLSFYYSPVEGGKILAETNES